MPEQALYLKWRPLAFDDVVGQEHITRTLRNALARDRIRHAYLFSGPRGTGKTTMARLLAKAVNCTHTNVAQRPCNACPTCQAINENRFLDLLEIDAASHTGVDDVRDLRDKIAFSPGEGSHKVYIIDEVHRFSGNAFDALLKTLEEPPDHAIFVLATTEIDKVPATIKSRCLQFEFRRVSLHEVSARLAYIAANESLDIDQAALELIARQGTGSVRDSISLLDQIVTDPDERVTLELTQRLLGTADSLQVRELVAALVAEDLARGIQLINAAVDGGSAPRQFGGQILSFLRNVMLAQTASATLIEASEEERRQYDELAGQMPRSQLLRAIRAFNDAINNSAGGWQPQLELELAFIESVQQPPEPALPAPAQAAQPAQAGPTSRPLSRSEQARAAVQAPAANGGPAYERAPASDPGAAPAFSATVIHQNWTNILSQANRYDRNVGPLLHHAHVRHIEGNRLVLGVASAFFQQRIATPDKARVIEQAIFDLHGVKLRIEARVFADVRPPDPAEAAQMPAAQDPLIATARSLGGVIDDAASNR
ncbi:MAG: DNA polymerase III subunit gamma/tau [Chloroflexi bacterium]|nr:DNA polymerase III subunit gamma/tau [Chloroflexota bacterium]MCY3582596.1 DNA polymerase III subunit gamma/tau [Chloroflexota bacterium]MCY3715276.1 DNA polymerase III subunit gamma/tau [Chloroflexota bacterium]MDE2652121.1 DNA polymerase III subunit gamma/tau [Chloroflexota bacterium]MXV92274.1 DNA polymerase III subunit gamma/tau [Chloroflexota bacterium]